MTLLTNSYCCFFIEVTDRGIASVIVTQVTTHTRGSVFIDGLPTRQEHMKVVIEILPLSDPSMAP